MPFDQIFLRRRGTIPCYEQVKQLGVQLERGIALSTQRLLPGGALRARGLRCRTPVIALVSSGLLIRSESAPTPITPIRPDFDMLIEEYKISFCILLISCQNRMRGSTLFEPVR